MLFVLLEININNHIVIDSYFFKNSYINIGIGHKKDTTAKEKQNIVKLLSDRNIILDIVKRLYQDNTPIKKEIENIIKIGQEKNTDFKNITKRGLRKIRQLINKKNELTCKKIFEEADDVNLNRKKNVERTLAKDMKATNLPPLSKHPEK